MYWAGLGSKQPQHSWSSSAATTPSKPTTAPDTNPISAPFAECVVRTVDPEDRCVRDVMALTILCQEHQVVGRECIDAALPLKSVIVVDSHLLPFLDSLPDRIGVARVGRLSGGSLLLPGGESAGIARSGRERRHEGQRRNNSRHVMSSLCK
jgi:hypothetical protein